LIAASGEAAAGLGRHPNLAQPDAFSALPVVFGEGAMPPTLGPGFERLDAVGVFSTGRAESTFCFDRRWPCQAAIYAIQK
jgi:hypothetical protein